MVLQILSDAGHVANHRDAERTEHIGRTQARQLQQLRRVNGAAR